MRLEVDLTEPKSSGDVLLTTSEAFMRWLEPLCMERIKMAINELSSS